MASIKNDKRYAHCIFDLVLVFCLSELQTFFIDDTAQFKGDWNEITLTLFPLQDADNKQNHGVTAVCSKENVDDYSYPISKPSVLGGATVGRPGLLGRIRVKEPKRRSVLGRGTVEVSSVII